MSFSKFISVILILWAGLAVGISEALAEKLEFDRHDLIFVKRTTDFTDKSPYSLVVFRANLPVELKRENKYLEERIFLGFSMYDPEKKTLIGYESDLKGSFGIGTRKNRKNKLRKKFRIFRIYPGHYILSHTTVVWPGTLTRIYISGETLTFEAKPGKIHYLGDFEIYPKDSESSLIGPIDYTFLGHDPETVQEVLKLYKDIDAELVIPEFSKDFFNCNNTTPFLSQRQQKKIEPFCETEMRKH